MDEVDPDKVGGSFSKMEKIADLVWKFKEDVNAACTDMQEAYGDQSEKENFWWNMGLTVARMSRAWKLYRFDAATRASV